MRHRRFIAALLVLSGIFTACGGRDDAEMTSESQKALNADASTAGVTVEVKDGVAVLKGEVADEEARARAAELARVNGINSVSNDVVVAVTPPPGSTVDDAGLKVKIEEALKAGNCGPISVEVKDGTATLSGEIERVRVGECVMAAQVITGKVENKLKFKD